MKIFAFTDTHGDEKLINKILTQIKQESPNIIICAGDISDFSKNLKNLILKFKDINIPFLIIPGNHETPKDIKKICEKTNFAIPLHKSAYEIGDYIFFGYGTGGFDKTNKNFEKMIPKFKEKMNNKKVILVTHAPPYKTNLDKLEHIGHQGSLSIRKFIEIIHPIVHICGHLHENAGNTDKINNTLILNPGNGKIIEI